VELVSGKVTPALPVPSERFDANLMLIWLSCFVNFRGNLRRNRFASTVESGPDHTIFEFNGKYFTPLFIDYKQTFLLKGVEVFENFWWLEMVKDLCFLH